VSILSEVGGRVGGALSAIGSAVRGAISLCKNIITSVGGKLFGCQPNTANVDLKDRIKAASDDDGIQCPCVIDDFFAEIDDSNHSDGRQMPAEPSTGAGVVVSADKYSVKKE
jgi:hypothetical protein